MHVLFIAIIEHFFLLVIGDRIMISVVSKVRNIDTKTLSLNLPSFYENWKKYQVPFHLTIYRMTEQKLINRNVGRPPILRTINHCDNLNDNPITI